MDKEWLEQEVIRLQKEVEELKLSRLLWRLLIWWRGVNFKRNYKKRLELFSFVVK